MSRNMLLISSEPNDLRVFVSERKTAAKTKAVEVNISVAISASWLVSYFLILQEQKKDIIICSTIDTGDHTGTRVCSYSPSSLQDCC
jgi:hypothetical protein